jgi:hypothetical protein
MATIALAGVTGRGQHQDALARQRLAGVLADEIGALIKPLTSGLNLTEQKKLSALLNKMS